MSRIDGQLRAGNVGRRRGDRRTLATEQERIRRTTQIFFIGRRDRERERGVACGLWADADIFHSEKRERERGVGCGPVG